MKVWGQRGNFRECFGELVEVGELVESLRAMLCFRMATSVCSSLSPSRSRTSRMCWKRVYAMLEENGSSIVNDLERIRVVSLKEEDGGLRATDQSMEAGHYAVPELFVIGIHIEHDG